MFQKITDNLFYLFIFLLPWQTVFILREPMIDGEKWQYGTVGFYLTDIILLAWLLLVLHRNQNAKCKNQNDKSKFRDSLLKIENCKLKIVNYISNSWQYKISCLLFIFLLWSFISISWSADSALAFYFSLKLLLGVGLFLALQKVKINWRKVIFVFLAVAVLQGVLAIGQFAFQDSFSSKWLGMSNYEVWQGGVSVLENEGGRWLRAYGSLPHPNILGGYLAVAFLLGIMAWSTENGARNNMSFPPRISVRDKLRRESRMKSLALEITLDSRLRGNDKEEKGVKSNLNSSNNFARLLILSSFLIILLGILLTFSRSAWLALAIGIIFLGATMGLKKNFVKLLLIFGLAGIIFVGVNHENFSTRFDAGKRLEQKSISERSLYFNQAKEIVGENFWLGTGAGNYTLSVFQKNKVKKSIWQYQPVHNVFMLIWAELGIVGLILFLIILISLFLQSYKLKNRNSFLCVILATLYILLFFDHWLWTTHFGILLFCLVAGLAVKKYKTYARTA